MARTQLRALIGGLLFSFVPFFSHAAEVPVPAEDFEIAIESDVKADDIREITVIVSNLGLEDWRGPLEVEVLELKREKCKSNKGKKSEKAKTDKSEKSDKKSKKGKKGKSGSEKKNRREAVL